MLHHIRSRRAALVAVLGAAAGLGACDRQSADTPLATDSALARDITLAGQSRSDVLLADTALGAVEPSAAPAPRPTRPTPRAEPRPRRETAPTRARPTVAEAPAPTPAPAAPAPAAPSRRSGAITLALGRRVCGDAIRVGDKLTATVRAADGGVAPEGATAVLEVASVTPAGNGTEARITFRIRAISENGETRPAAGEVATTGPLEQVQTGKKGNDRKKVIGGAVAGAILGQIMGGDTKSTVIGAAAGAAAGTAAAKMSGGGVESCIPDGAVLQGTASREVSA